MIFILADADIDVPGWVEAIGTWFGAFGTIAVAFLAIFQDLLRRRFIHPKCELQCGTSGVFSQSFTDKNQMPFTQLRFQIRNTGSAPAREVEVHLLGVYSVNENKLKSLPGFVPTRLQWTHDSKQFTRAYLVQGTSALVDFGTIRPHLTSDQVASRIVPDNLLSLNAEAESTDIWDYPGGSYVFEIGVICNEGYLYRGNVEVEMPTLFGTSNTRVKHRQVLPLP